MVPKCVLLASMALTMVTFPLRVFGAPFSFSQWRSLYPRPPRHVGRSSDPLSFRLYDFERSVAVDVAERRLRNLLLPTISCMFDLTRDAINERSNSANAASI